LLWKSQVGFLFEVLKKKTDRSYIIILV
jgi:hypothetical protein